MKKLKTQTGLVRSDENAKAHARKESGKSSKKKQAKTRQREKKTKKAKKTKEPKPPKEKKRKQGGKGKPYQAKTFADLTEGKTRATDYTREELEKQVKRLAGIANRRLTRLEEKGLTNTPAYKRAHDILGTIGREKYSGAVKSMTYSELSAEFTRLRDFLSLKTSTAAGVTSWKRNVYNSLVDAGFEGSQQEISELFDKYMTKELESLLGSDTIYILLQSEAGRPFLQRALDAIDYANTAGISQGEALGMEFGITTDKMAAQIMAQYLGDKL